MRTTDTKSRPQRENSYKLNLFITDTPMMTVLIQHDFLFVVTYQSVINCLIVHTITVSCFQSVKIILSTCHCHLSSRFLTLWRLSSCCFPFSTSFLFDFFTWKTIFTDSWVFCKIQALLQTLNEFVRSSENIFTWDLQTSLTQNESITKNFH